MTTSATTEVTPPALQGPTSKERKYDRQLRLWAANGQAALEDARILLINSGPGVVGIETLKNLILPGVGHFTILDPVTVAEADVGVNFFLEEDDISQSRAERCCKWLQELNPDVEGDYVTQPIEQFISSRRNLDRFTLILVILPLAPRLLEIISDHSTTTGTPVFYIHSVGFYSHFTVQLPSAFPIVDTHPDPVSTTDLRLLKPWPELLAVVKAKTSDLEQMDDEQHGHVPYLLLLLHYLEKWNSTHDGKPPQNYKEKVEFRELVRQGTRTKNAEGGEENFEEAVGAVLKSLNPPEPSSAAREVFAATECQELTAESADFWIIAHAISDFHSKHGGLPLSGSLPDMKAKSADYIQLQNIYKSKARNDVAEVTDRVRELERGLGRVAAVEQKEIDLFCKSCGYIKLVRGRPPHLAQDHDNMRWKDRASLAANALTDPDSLILLYIAFLAYDSYCTQYSMVEGVGDRHSSDEARHFSSETAITASIAATLIVNLKKEAGVSIDESERDAMMESVASIVRELIRAGGGELHNIAAATGGMVAQEVIKVITKQYIPIDNTCLFDGITSKSSVLRL